MRADDRTSAFQIAHAEDVLPGCLACCAADRGHLVAADRGDDHRGVIRHAEAGVAVLRRADQLAERHRTPPLVIVSGLALYAVLKLQPVRIRLADEAVAGRQMGGELE
jgi:hypothetical protein